MCRCRLQLAADIDAGLMVMPGLKPRPTSPAYKGPACKGPGPRPGRPGLAHREGQNDVDLHGHRLTLQGGGLEPVTTRGFDGLVVETKLIAIE